MRKEAGAVNPYTVSRWESGVHRPSPFYRAKLCQLYNLSAADLGFLPDVPQHLPATQMRKDLSVQPAVSDREHATMSGEENIQPLSFKHDEVAALERETLDMDKVRRQLIQQALGVIGGIRLLTDEDDLWSILKFMLLPLKELSSRSLTIIAEEDFIRQCEASIKSCWYLMQGREFAIIEEVLAAFIPSLTSLGQQSVAFRTSATGLLTQAYRLKGIVALHYNDLKARESNCQQAVSFAKHAENASLLVSALTSLASTYYYGKDPQLAADTYQQGLLYEEQIPFLQRSRLYAELAVVTAQQGHEREAQSYQAIANQLYPDSPERDPSYHYAEFSPASAILERGLTYLALAQHYQNRGYERQAWDTFSEIEPMRTQRNVPDRIFYEIINHQTQTALIMRELDVFCSLIEQAIQGARRLNSQQRRLEVIALYRDARDHVWPHEPRVRDLADVFLR